MTEQPISYYSIVRYVPDPIKAECANFGVFVVTGGRAKFHSIKEWSRLRAFGGEDVAFLKDFVRDAREISDEGTVRRLASKWRNSIQFTELRPSLMDNESLLVYATRTFLAETVPAELGYRRKADVVKKARRIILGALEDRVGSLADVFLKSKYSVQGETGKHTFDLAAANGHPYFLAQAISFEIADEREIEKQVDAAAWAIEDVRKQLAELPIGVVTLPPKVTGERDNVYANAKKIFVNLNADALDEAALPAWAQQAAAKVPLGGR
ncbi:MAG: DUF3037 domain-containing protein [Phycisphaerae bacterium]